MNSPPGIKRTFGHARDVIALDFGGIVVRIDTASGMSRTEAARALADAINASVR